MRWTFNPRGTIPESRGKHEVFENANVGGPGIVNVGNIVINEQTLSDRKESIEWKI